MRKNYSSILSVEKLFGREKGNASQAYCTFSRFFFWLLGISFFFLMFTENMTFVQAANTNVLVNVLKEEIELKNYTQVRVVCESLSDPEFSRLQIKFFCALAYVMESETTDVEEYENLNLSNKSYSLINKRQRQLRENQRKAQKLFSSIIAVLDPIEQKKQEQKQKNSEEVSALLLQSYFYRGVSSFLYRNYDQAVADFQKLLSFQPYNRSALFNLAVCLQEQGELTKARVYFQRLYSVDKNFIANHLVFSRLRNGKNNRQPK